MSTINYTCKTNRFSTRKFKRVESQKKSASDSASKQQAPPQKKSVSASDSKKPQTKKKSPSASASKQKEPSKKKISKTKLTTKNNLVFSLTAQNAFIRNNINEAEHVAYKYDFNRLLHYCLLKKTYDNFIVMINPTIDISENKQIYKNLRLFIVKDKINYMNYTRTNFIEQLRELSRSRKIIIIYVGYYKHDSVLIYDTRNPAKYILYYFEAHGSSKKYELKPKVKEKIKKAILQSQEGIKNLTLYWPNSFLPEEGYQVLDQKDKDSLKSNLSGDAFGYCSYWCLYFVNMVLKFPDIPIVRLVAENLKLLKGMRAEGKTDFHRHIRTYSQGFEIATEKEYHYLDLHFHRQNHLKYKTHNLSFINIISEYTNDFKMFEVSIIFKNSKIIYNTNTKLWILYINEKKIGEHNDVNQLLDAIINKQ